MNRDYIDWLETLSCNRKPKKANQWMGGRATTEQTFTEDFLETKTCPKSRCKVRRYLPYLVSKTTTA